MKKTYLLFILAIIVVFIAGCNANTDTYPAAYSVIVINNSQFSLDPQQDTEAIVPFDIPDNWTTTISYLGDDKDWLTVGPGSGKRGVNLSITLTATTNPAEVERKAHVFIHYGKQKHKLTITQDFKLAPTTNLTARFDTQFSALLQARGYIPNAEKILYSDVMHITALDISATSAQDKLQSMVGIQYFTALTSLSCSNNIFTDLDMSKNTTLTTLRCNSNLLTSIDISKNTALTTLRCNSNLLTSIDISKNTALTTFLCSGNPGINGGFIVTAWFDNNNIPEGNFTKTQWVIETMNIGISYKKEKSI